MTGNRTSNGNKDNIDRNAAPLDTVLNSGTGEGNGENKSWWKENWDKVIIGFLGLVISGIAGYFSAIVAVNRQLSELETIAKTNEFKIGATQPDVAKIGIIEVEQNRQKDRIDDLERENRNSETIRGIIQIRDDQVKQATIQYLEGLIEEIRKK